MSDENKHISKVSKIKELKELLVAVFFDDAFHCLSNKVKEAIRKEVVG